jgi:hypothetical protein
VVVDLPALGSEPESHDIRDVSAPGRARPGPQDPSTQGALSTDAALEGVPLTGAQRGRDVDDEHEIA